MNVYFTPAVFILSLFNKVIMPNRSVEIEEYISYSQRNHRKTGELSLPGRLLKKGDFK